ncbi:RND transporter [Beijerinckiaceae bacterium RH AL1]|nr:MMPL family transporter [Beijerinckiaceae bacterium]VVB49705.1 RND transporter [Beijerinckiaceae bacterium RH CH11]VVB49782.1 RND transporter [Beijerinckiaceae bacterium RH AL8]VVC57036.1 RND transporter [Beijerinckiaceae bacterium RH AL1]
MQSVESEVQSSRSGTGTPDTGLPQLAFGTERMGLISLRAPFLVGIVFAILAVAAVFGAMKLKVDDSLSQLFRSNTPQFRQYEAVTRDFPSSEYDVLVVISGKDLLVRDNVEKIRNLVTDLQLIDGERSIISMFSAREPPKPGQTIPPALFPEPLPEGQAYDDLVKKIRANELINGKLISPDGTLALVVLALNPDVASSSKSGNIVKQIRQTMSEDLEGSNLKGELAGVPVMQLEIHDSVERDRVIYNLIGFVAGCLIAILFFRRVSFMLVAAAPPLVAILISVGALGWLDFRLNIFLNVMTPLIMVISFSDSMQLTFAIRDRLVAGQSKAQAIRGALAVVGPACVLTHTTTMVSFVALLFSDSDLIKVFGEAGLLTTAIALVTVLVLLPLLAVTLVRGEVKLAQSTASSDTAINMLRGFCRWIAERMVSHPGVYSLISIVVCIVLSIIYTNLQPRYRLADQVPNNEQAVTANGSLDRKLTGANPVDVLIEIPKGEDLYSPATLATLEAVQRTTASEPGVGNVFSLQTLRDWLSQKLGENDVETLKKYVGYIPEPLVRRFVAADQRSALVSGRIPDKDASQLLPVVDDLDARLDAVRKAHPGYQISVTGLAVIAARNSALMIERLSRGLTVEIVFVAGFIGLAFRSWKVMLLAIMPGIFPIIASGALLYAMGEGLQFASVVALTVSFGLGLSATIHFLNRLRLEERPGENAAVSVERATILVGPALILTSVVLACGLAVTAFSNLPMLRLFGWLSAFAMIAALVADLLILRPTAMYLYSLVPASLKHRPAE